MKDAYHSSSGWMMITKKSGVFTYAPESRVDILIRYLPLWLPLAIFVPNSIHDPATLLILLPIQLTVGIVASRRAIYPTFYATERICSFGLKGRFKTKFAALVERTKQPLLISVANQDKHLVGVAWAAIDQSEAQLVKRNLVRFIGDIAIAEQSDGDNH